MLKHNGLTLALALLAALMSSTGAGAPLLDWPLKGKMKFNSLFCDYRPSHFHSGLDLSTGGRMGLPVYSPEAGQVIRAYTSFWGYGRAVYVQIESGEILVFAHLSRLAPRIESKVRAAQFETKNYRVDLGFVLGKIPVRKGEIIGYTGQSGAGGPHLHFEMRDSENRPINPFIHGYSPPDTIPPVIEEIAIRRFPGQVAPGPEFLLQVESLAAVGDGDRGLDGYLHAEGIFGFEVSAFDATNSSSGVHGIYSLELSIDEELVFQKSFDRFSYDQTRNQQIVRDFGILRAREEGKLPPREDYDRRTMYNLYDPVTMEGIFCDETAGSLGTLLPPGLHQARLEVADASGNRSVAEFELLVSAPPEVEYMRLYEEDGTIHAEARLNWGDFSVSEVRFENLTTQGHWNLLGSIPGSLPETVYEMVWEDTSREGVLARCRPIDVWGLPGRYFYGGLNLAGRAQESDASLNPGDLEFEAVPVYGAVILQFPPRNCISSPVTVSIRDANGNLPESEPLISTTVSAGVEGTVEIIPLDLGDQATLRVTAEARDCEGRKIARIVEIESAGALRGRKSLVFLAGEEIAISFGPDDLYSHLVTYLETDTVQAGEPVVAGPVRIGPYWMPFRSKPRLMMRLPGGGRDKDPIGLFQLSGGEWEFVGGERTVPAGTGGEQTYIGGEINHLGTFALLEDTDPPRIGRLRPKNSAKVTDRTPLISVSLADDLSGIVSEEDVEMFIDGMWVPAEYDSEQERFSYQVRSKLIPGEHAVEVAARDGLGNSRRVRWTFHIQ